MKRSLCWAGALSLLFCSVVGAGEGKVAVVNVSLIVENYEKLIGAQRRMDATYNPE